MKRLPKSFTTITPFSKAIGITLFVILPFAGFFMGIKYQKMHDVWIQSNSTLTPKLPWKGDRGETVCTMDAKICPDGSSVGRAGPDCEFAPCPGEEGSFCGGIAGITCPAGYRCQLQDTYPDAGGTCVGDSY